MSNPTATDVDIFAGIDDKPVTGEATTDSTENPTDNSVNPTPAEGDNANDSQNDAPVETFASVPDGCVTIQEFAALMTQTMMKAKFEAGEDLDQNDYVVPQSVYQTVKAQRERIPHVLVKGADDAEARVYIKRDEAITWWLNRKDRLSTRGTGSQRASSRSAEDNLTLLSAAVYKSLYADSRLKLWQGRVEQATNLVEKYKGFLTEQKADADTVTLTIQEATDRFNSDQAAKEAEKAAKAKKSGASADNAEGDNE